MFNKKDTALIQMAEAQQAALAINHLDKTKLWGKIIRVMHSKHTNVQVGKVQRRKRKNIYKLIHFSCQRTVSRMLG